MASSKNYLEFVLEQLSELDDVTYRSMMGEYILYFRGKIIGGIYDNLFLVKPVQAVLDKIDQPSFEFPYEGAKEMILVEDLDNKIFLEDLILAMYDQLPMPKPKKKKQMWTKQQRSLLRAFLLWLKKVTNLPNIAPNLNDRQRKITIVDKKGECVFYLIKVSKAKNILFDDLEELVGSL